MGDATEKPSAGLDHLSQSSAPSPKGHHPSHGQATHTAVLPCPWALRAGNSSAVIPGPHHLQVAGWLWEGTECVQRGFTGRGANMQLPTCDFPPVPSLLPVH